MKYDKLLVVDVEATCDKNKDSIQSEIIEIGYCFLDIKTGEITTPKSIYVKNEYSPITQFCTELTTITQYQLDTLGISFEEACNKLLDEVNSKQYIICTYGDFDITQFHKDCSRKNAPYPFLRKHINIKTLFALRNKLSKEMGLAKALKYANIEMEGIHHQGRWDAYNTAKLLKTII